ncbi:DNA/RNA non-specific endonuclease [Clostridium sp.]|uniref:DNA/RNA non-specific endonuclease n=1 Tax=Clostridium sp. TaxID=1506 RepID=UPI002611A25E|nr:DNA/RNA non-specific endonuclease [Clostridium sp.]
MKNIFKLKKSLITALGVLVCLFGFISCSSTNISSTNNSGQVTENSNSNNILLTNPNENNADTNISISDIPKYSGKDYIILNNNVPNFSEADLTTTSFEEYSPLDSLGRCGVAYSNIGTDIMPTEKRESISSVKPSGWQSVKYDIVEGKYLYNRSHLIGYQLTAENANDRNLITGTRYFNATLMLPYENMVADYIKETNNHVLYRVTPVFEGNNLVATGVQMEAKSVEDNGEGIEFNVFVYNVQPGITIDYATGNSALSGEEIVKTESSYNNTTNSTTNSNNANTNTTTNSTASNNNSTNNSNSANNTTYSNEKTVIRGNSKSKIYHCPGQKDYENMSDSKYLVNFNSEQEAIDAGYRKASR